MTNTPNSEEYSSRKNRARLLSAQSRRRFLQVSIAMGVPGITGCQSDGDATTPQSPIERIAFEEESMIVRVSDSVAGEEVHLVTPDNQLEAKAETEKSTNEAQLLLLSIGDPTDSKNHYPPGEYTLIVAPGTEDEFSESIDLRPHLEITGIKQYNGDESASIAHVAISVKNTGTGPTWISDIGFQNGPNSLVNDEIPPDHHPSFIHPEENVETILTPGQKKAYVPQAAPLTFSDDRNKCDRHEVTFDTVVASPRSPNTRREIQFSSSGDVTAVDLLGSYACEDYEINFTEGE